MTHNILKIVTICLVMFITSHPECSGQFNIKKLKDATKSLTGAKSGGFSKEEAGKAIKEALEKGTTSGVAIVSKPDGYLKRPEIKIPFPPEAQKVEKKLREVGMGKKVDDAVVAINRAAEDAAVAAKNIFIDAIKAMTIKDAINIIKGEDNAATEYLRRTVGDQLKSSFMPKIRVSLEKVNATKYWSDVINTYNKIPFVEKVNPDLAEYVTDKAIYGLFVMIAKEELKIRQDPIARTTDLLKKVFGG